MIYFKACPKCQGDLHLAEDIHGCYVSCLQCGFLRDLDSAHQLFTQRAGDTPPPPVALPVEPERQPA